MTTTWIWGDLDDMIDALILNDQAQRLQEGKEC